jgi:hypothetical protein
LDQKQTTAEPSTDDIAAATARPPADQEQTVEAPPATRAQQAQAPASPSDAVQTNPTETSAPAQAPGAPLLADDTSADLRGRWREIQTQFVDDPRQAVAAADGLVAELMQTLASGFAERRHALEDQWQRGEDVGTEDLRMVLQQYRAFFDRLLSA